MAALFVGTQLFHTDSYDKTFGLSIVTILGFTIQFLFSAVF